MDAITPGEEYSRGTSTKPLPTVRRLSRGRRNPAVVFAIACASVAASCGQGAPRDLVRALDEAGAPPSEAAPAVADARSGAHPPPQLYGPPPPRTEDPPPTEASLASVPADLAALSAVLVVPVAGVLRSQLRDSYAEARGGGLHEAMDVLVPRGTPVLSAADGRVLKLFDSRPGGLMVYATDASERFILLYGHLDGYADGLRDGMPLVRGQVIGYVGTSGNAPADNPHLHFEILRGEPAVAWWKGVPVNPYLLLARSGG
jgi:peptidoglycan LD-endopeptidase LytH